MHPKKRHLVFWLDTMCCYPRKNSQISLSAMYSECGYSGTETAVLEVARHLVHTFRVTVVCGTETTQEEGITFTQTMPQDADIFCPTFFEPPPDILAKVPQNAVAWMWMHMIVPESTVTVFAPRKVIGSYLSAFAEKHTPKDAFASTITLGNGISKEVFATHIPTEKKKGSWIFHATHERGGAVAHKAFQYTRSRNPEAAQSLRYASYYIFDGHESLSKMALRDVLSETEYFVYPLVLPTGQVNHDTYACVILEALARGVIVVTWAVACIPGVYGDYVVALDPVCWQGYDPAHAFASNPWMLTDDAVAALGDAVLSIEADPARKKAMQERGSAWAQTQTWESVAAKYEAWLLMS